MPPSLKPRKAVAPANPGCVDFIAFSRALDGWIACGWIAREWQESDAAPGCALDFGEACVQGDGTICLFAREDVVAIGAGFVLFVPGGGAHARHELVELRLASAWQAFSLKPAHQVERPSEVEAIARCKAHLVGAPVSDRRARLLALLNRPAFAGVDTLQSLPSPVFLEIDSAVLCPPDGLLLHGWFADPFDKVAAIRVRGGEHAQVLDPTAWIATARDDVARRMVETYPDFPQNCGFMAYVPGVTPGGEGFHLEVELEDGAVGFKCAPPVRSPGLRAITDVLSRFDLRYQEMVRAYDCVVGPAVSALNAFARAHAPAIRALQFGVQPVRPRCSIIVPLHGRIDFMEYQLAFFARSLANDHELIYVLDDPPQLRAAETLATSCLARFGLPFRLLAPAENVGFGPASNIGLRHARGETVCFLNSDVFPKRPDWLERMLETLEGNAHVGMVGALLLYEDDTIQHEGCSFARLAEFGNWMFCLHPNKGRLPGADESLLMAEAVTGACQVMRTDLARALGGFDEGYVIGDFEDADLCRQVQKAGLACVVDRRAQLYHLERQSQGGQQMPWRLNLTLFNAWRFQARWGSAA
jgi:GT2 family glycosyltransferase